MGLLADCLKYFGSQSFYDIFDISNNASDKDLKKAYYKASLKVHPDRVEEVQKAESTIKFQILGKVYSILSDKEKRILYDETGEFDDEAVLEEKDWDKYWRHYFQKISVSDIKNFESKYQGSEEELSDLMEMYIKGEGKMDFILENVLCASLDDEERFKKIIKKWIKDGKVESFANFTEESLKRKNIRKRKAATEAAEAEELKHEMGLNNSEESLQQMIMSRGAARGNQAEAFFDHLASKYASKKTGKSRAKV